MPTNITNFYFIDALITILLWKSTRMVLTTSQDLNSKCSNGDGALILSIFTAKSMFVTRLPKSVPAQV